MISTPATSFVNSLTEPQVLAIVRKVMQEQGRSALASAPNLEFFGEVDKDRNLSGRLVEFFPVLVCAVKMHL